MSDTEKSENITDIVFQKTAQSGVEFELAITAVVASAVLTTLPNGLAGKVLTTGSLLLSVLTVIRWMAVNGRFADSEAIISTSTRSVEFLTVISIFHVINAGVSRIQYLLPQEINPITLTGFTALLSSFTIIVLMEILFRNYRIWWGSVFYVRTLATKREIEETEGLKSLILFLLFNIWAQTAYLILKGSIPDDDTQEWNELSEFVQNVEDETDGKPDTSSWRLLLATGIIVFPAFALVAGLLSILFGTIVEMFVLILAVWSLRHIVGFLYLAFGTAKLDDFLLNNRKAIMHYACYAAAVYVILY